MTRPMRVLIVRVGAMGDVLHGMPAVAALRNAWPNAEIGWAVEPRWAALLQSSAEARPRSAEMPQIDRVHLVPTKQWSKQPLSRVTLDSVLALRRELRTQKYDLAIDLQGSIRSAVIAKMSGALQVVGSMQPRERPARWFYDKCPPPGAVHVIEQAAEIVSSAASTRLHPMPAALPIDTEAELWCDGVLGADARPIVFLAPTAGWGAKQWPVEKFAEVAVACARAGLRVLVNQAGPQDRVAAELVRTAEGFAEPVDCSIAQMIALMRRVSLAIAGDTGPLHLAAALVRPVVALFGPTDPARNGPYASPARVLRSAASVTDHRRHAATEAGLREIRVQDVLAAAEELLGCDLLPHAAMDNV